MPITSPSGIEGVYHVVSEEIELYNPIPAQELNRLYAHIHVLTELSTRMYIPVDIAPILQSVYGLEINSDESLSACIRRLTEEIVFLTKGLAILAGDDCPPEIVEKALAQVRNIPTFAPVLAARRAATTR